MKYIFLNLKRFDIPTEFGGVNQISPILQWGKYIIKNTQDKLIKYKNDDVHFMMFFPEAHLIPAMEVLDKNNPLKIGCQGVFREDTVIGGNFGAFTTNRTANAAKAIGCEGTIIGHCEERKDKEGILAEVGIKDNKAINHLLNKEIKCAINAGLKVLYCIGEKIEEKDNWQDTLREQLEIGLSGIDKESIVIAYEPVWAIGPGKTPPNREYIQKIGRFIKEVTNGLPVVYGGGLKQDNAEMLSSIPEIDGGLIALTRFSGEIGYYPEEYLEIIDLYMQ